MPWSGAATGASPFKVGDNQRPKRTMTGVRKPSPESSVPVGNLTRGSRRNQLRRGHGSPPVLSEVFSSLALRCALQRVQTVPAAIHSGRIPPPQPTSHGDGRLSQPPHHTGHGPFRTRPPTSVKSPFQFYFSLPFFVNFLSSQYAHSGPAIHTEE